MVPLSSVLMALLVSALAALHSDLKPFFLQALLMFPPRTLFAVLGLFDSICAC